MRTERSKAEFRAVRERVGLTQRVLADRLGNTVDMVKKWENPKYVTPPEDAWDLLDTTLEEHRRIVNEAVRHMRALTPARGTSPERVELTYYRSQTQYDELGRDDGDYNVVNARTREIAAILERDGFSVVYRSPTVRYTDIVA